MSDERPVGVYREPDEMVRVMSEYHADQWSLDEAGDTSVSRREWEEYERLVVLITELTDSWDAARRAESAAREQHA